MCEEKEVTVECIDCKKLMCQNCSTKHAIKKMHHIKKIGKFNTCSLHSKKADFICIDCLTFVCLTCTHQSVDTIHTKHEIKNVSDLIKTIDSKVKNKIESTLKYTNKTIKMKVEQLENLKNQVFVLNDQIEKLTKNHDEAVMIQETLNDLDLMEKIEFIRDSFKMEPLVENIQNAPVPPPFPHFSIFSPSNMNKPPPGPPLPLFRGPPPPP
jgi:uncharacterized protein with von Willebrand factor type A (vWA) domain